MLRAAVIVTAGLAALLAVVGPTGTARAATASVADGTLTIAYTATGTTAEHVTIAMSGATVTLTGDVSGDVVSTPTKVTVSVPNEADSTDQSLTFLDGTYLLTNGVLLNNPNLDRVTLGSPSASGSISISGQDTSLYFIAGEAKLASDATLTSTQNVSFTTRPIDGAHALSVFVGGAFHATTIGATTPLTSLAVAGTTGRKGAAKVDGAFRTTGDLTFTTDLAVVAGSALTSTTGAVSVTGRITTSEAGAQLTVGNATASTITESLARSPEGPLGPGIDLVKNGSGTLTLATSSSTFNGTATVHAGTLLVQSQYGLGQSTPGGVVVDSGATLAVAPATLDTGVIQLSGTLATSGSGAHTLAGTVHVADDAVVDVGPSASLTVYELTDPATPAGLLSKRGAGSLRIDSATSFGSAIAIDAGTITQSAGDALGTGTVTIADGACLELAGTYTLTGPERIEAGGTCGGAGAISTTGAGAAVTVAVPIRLSASTTIVAGTSTTLTIGGGVTSAPGAALTLAGSGGVTLTSNVAAGALTATVPLRIENAAGTPPPETIVSTTGTQTYTAALTLAGDATLEASGLVGAGDITADGSGQRNLTLAITGSTSTYTGKIGGAGGSSIGLIKTGAGSITVAAGTYTGPTRARAGTLRLTTSSATQAVTAEETGLLIVDTDITGASAVVEERATLSGSGSLQDVRVDGTLSLTALGSLTFGMRKLNGLGGTVAAAVGDPRAHTAITVTGSGANATRLDNLRLALQLTATPTSSDPIMLIDNRGELIGAFLDAPQDALLTAGSTRWRIDYAGGDGDDVTLTYVPPPAISAVTPSSGTTAGGTVVTISGSGFDPSAAVAVDGAACASTVVASRSTITCTTPAHAAGAVPITVTNPDGQTGTLAAAFTYQVPPGPTPPPPVVKTPRISAPTVVRRTVRVSITTYGAGTATISTATGCRASKRVTKATTLSLRCRITGRAKRVRVTTTFTPKGGAKITRSEVVRLSRSLTSAARPATESR